VPRARPFLMVGHGVVGRKVAEILRDAGETARVLDPEAGDGKQDS
jgi:UDP-N-acetylmuramoylalanine-D-glutamate ligase